LDDVVLEMTTLADNALDLAESRRISRITRNAIMGILKSLFTLGKSVLSQAEESIEEAQGVRMLEQHIRDAKMNWIKPANRVLTCWHA
jgi:hypothetical protein